MEDSLPKLLRDVIVAQQTLHAAGTLSAAALAALVRHASARTIFNSAETGCGATTVLLSHLSRNHTVFSLNVGGSVANVRRSPLLRGETVTFVEGPSQSTLAAHQFSGTLQLVLIDGPHAYPFPDLEYYFLYPHLASGALLVVDDIQIRSIHNLFNFLRCDPMFHLDEVVHTTAFFTRTDAPAFDPHGDGWQSQPYNQRPLLRYDWRSRISRVLGGVKRRDYEGLRDHSARSGRNGATVHIHSPGAHDPVSQTGIVQGTAVLPENGFLWILVHRRDVVGWWPQGGSNVTVVNGAWAVQVQYGSAVDLGREFEIGAIVVSDVVHERWREWVKSVAETRQYPPVRMPRRADVLAATFQTVNRR